jgi:hypothetical protein
VPGAASKSVSSFASGVSTALNTISSTVGGGPGRVHSNSSNADNDDESYMNTDGLAWTRPARNTTGGARARIPSGNGVEMDGLSSKGK